MRPIRRFVLLDHGQTLDHSPPGHSSVAVTVSVALYFLRSVWDRIERWNGATATRIDSGMRLLAREFVRELRLCLPDVATLLCDVVFEQRHPSALATVSISSSPSSSSPPSSSSSTTPEHDLPPCEHADWVPSAAELQRARDYIFRVYTACMREWRRQLTVVETTVSEATENDVTYYPMSIRRSPRRNKHTSTHLAPQKTFCSRLPSKK
jgi:hypothetical protein